MVPDALVWTVWSTAFLAVWIVVYARFAKRRRMMLWASLFTAPLGLTEPLFVPEYWNPLGFFGLAQRTGFDVESLIFCFAIGGIAAVAYPPLFQQKERRICPEMRAGGPHRYHRLALATPLIVFVLFSLGPWNAIYSGIAAMLAGGLATMLSPFLRTPFLRALG